VVDLVRWFRAIVLKLSPSAQVRSSVTTHDDLRALAIMGAGPDRDALQAIFHDADWALTITDTPVSAIDLQREGPAPIVLCERELTTYDWRATVSGLSRLSPRPCVILLSGSSDRNLWDELGRCGGCDILRTPVERDAVMRTVRAGWSLWRHQQRLRLPAEAHF
jgi:DNA-binding NtrC family response regulator